LIRQYDAFTGQQVGSLQVVLSGQPADSLGAIGYLNGHIYVGASRFQQPFGGMGTVDPLTGEFTALVPLSTGSNLDSFQGGFIAGQEGAGRGLYDANFNPIGSFTLDEPTGIEDNYYGTATTSTGFATTWVNSFSLIFFWSNTSQFAGERSFNNNNPVGPLFGLEYDEANNGFWIGEGSSTSMIRYYGPSSPNQVWSSSVPGVISDLAYIPIPAPSGIGLVGAASLLCLRRRR
jgi:hypothetical protein